MRRGETNAKKWPFLRDNLDGGIEATHARRHVPLGVTRNKLAGIEVMPKPGGGVIELPEQESEMVTRKRPWPCGGGERHRISKRICLVASAAGSRENCNIKLVERARNEVK